MSSPPACKRPERTGYRTPTTFAFPRYLLLGLLAVARLCWLSYHDCVCRELCRPGSWVGAFGDKFRKAREKKNLSLDDVSNVTKIGSRMLKAIEDERFDQLPGGVFNKGFIRAYAKHLGLDDSEAVTDYLAAMREAQVEAANTWEPERPGQSRATAPAKQPPLAAKAQLAPTQAPPPTDELPDLQLPRAEHVRPPRKDFAEKRDGGIPWGIVAVAVVVIALASILWSRHSRGTRAEGPRTVQAAPVATVVASSVNASANTTPSPTNETSPARPGAATTPSAHASTPQPANAAARPAPAAAPQANGAPAHVPAANPVAAKTPAAVLTLIIRASENSWISVTADGQTVSQETLIAPAHTSVRATREIVVRAGNAAGVSFLWNGQEIPAQGSEAEAKTYIFDAAGMRIGQ